MSTQDRTLPDIIDVTFEGQLIIVVKLLKLDLRWDQMAHYNRLLIVISEYIKNVKA